MEKLNGNESIEFVENIGDYGEILCKNIIKTLVIVSLIFLGLILNAYN